MNAAEDRQMERDVELAYERRSLGPVLVNDEQLARLLVRATRNSLKYTMAQALAAIQRERQNYANKTAATAVSRRQPDSTQGTKDGASRGAGISERTHAVRDGASERATPRNEELAL